MDLLVQAEFEQWPSGNSKHLLVLRFSPEEISSRYQLEFIEDQDDLDYFQKTTFLLQDGTLILLERHRGDPIPGVVAHIDSEADFASSKEMLMESLRITEEDVLWTSPRVTEEEERG